MMVSPTSVLPGTRDWPRCDANDVVNAVTNRIRLQITCYKRARICATEAADDKRDPVGARDRAERRRANRGALPAHLPRVHVMIAPEDTNCPCCRAPMHVIGEDAAERLDVIPAQFRVIVTHRPKYACRACEQAVVQVPAPERLIKGGLPTEAMVAHVLVAKYAWHLPLYRQAQMLLAQGLDIKRSILAFWVGYAAAELKPIYLRLRELILASGKIAVDETVAPVLDPGRGRTKKGAATTAAIQNNSGLPPRSRTPHSLALSRASRCRRRAAEQRDELAPPHAGHGTSPPQSGCRTLSLP
jgi:transposase